MFLCKRQQVIASRTILYFIITSIHGPTSGTHARALSLCNSSISFGTSRVLPGAQRLLLRPGISPPPTWGADSSHRTINTNLYFKDIVRLNLCTASWLLTCDNKKGIQTSLCIYTGLRPSGPHDWPWLH
jgi:hypothetical protein